MVKKTIVGVAIGLTINFLVVASALAASNPSGNGQPNVECGEDGITSAPAGFSTGGFANAEDHYAGSDGTQSQANANSDHAVSQYDVACYQQTQNH